MFSSELNENDNTNECALGRYNEWALMNPIPNEIDQITKSKMKVPTISPDGYVLDYSTWLKHLKNSKENPFTGIPVRRRQLVVLTFKNIEEYVKKIVNLDIEENGYKIE